VEDDTSVGSAPFVEGGPAAGSESAVRNDPVVRDGHVVGLDSAQAAGMLISVGASRAVFVSPEGDEAAASAVLVARDIADSGLRVLLIDLTASGAASGPMLDGARVAGITNLLAAEAKFVDVIHADHYSDCHVIPVGTADQARADHHGHALCGL
jgi:Mrp family chromosome partitioning ATPase